MEAKVIILMDLDMIASNKLGKNAFVVGASADVLDYTGPESVSQASFTSWGPTDDWRIKPDITAVGTNSYSTREESDDDYASGQGCSYAAPVVAGGLALLQQHFHNINNVYMKAATAKALILSTADEAGEFDGPDFSNGWGLFNARKAADVITNNGITSEILELNLDQDNVYTKTINVNGTEPLSVAINWNDPAAKPLSNATYNDPTPMLINDLDLRVSSDNEEYFPWKMEPNIDYNNYTAAAEKGDNYRDNTEIIYEENVPAGEYTITVSHKNVLETGTQDFSMVINGIQEEIITAKQSEDNVGSTIIFSSPVNDLLEINFTSPQQLALATKVTVFDLAGKNLMARTFKSQESIQLDVSQLSAGIYIIQVHDSAMQLIGVNKLVKD